MSWTPPPPPPPARGTNPPPPPGRPAPPPPPGYPSSPSAAGHSPAAPGPGPGNASTPPHDQRPAPPAPPGPAGPPAPAAYGAQGSWPAAAPAAGAEHGNLGLALVGGVAGSFVAGLVWWGIVAATQYQVTYVALGVGWVVAQAVLICCAQHNRLPLQAVAGVFTLLALAVSEYFIQRTLFIKEYGDRFDGVSVPLWDGFGAARDVVEESLREDPLTGLFWLAAAVTAVVVAGSREALTHHG